MKVVIELSETEIGTLKAAVGDEADKVIREDLEDDIHTLLDVIGDQF